MSGQVSAVEVLQLSHADLPVMIINGEAWVAFARVMEQLGLNAEAQTRRLRRQPWAVVRYAPVPVPGDQPRRTVVVDEATFLGHVFTVQSSRVAAGRRDTLVAYQRETVKAIRDYWTRGIAVNPRHWSDEDIALLEAGSHASAGALDDLQVFNYWDQVTDGRRDMPDGMTAGKARARSLTAARRAFRRLVEPALRVAHLPGIGTADDATDQGGLSS